MLFPSSYSKSFQELLSATNPDTRVTPIKNSMRTRFFIFPSDDIGCTFLFSRNYPYQAAWTQVTHHARWELW